VCKIGVQHRFYTHTLHWLSSYLCGSYFIGSDGLGVMLGLGWWWVLPAVPVCWVELSLFAPMMPMDGCHVFFVTSVIYLVGRAVGLLLWLWGIG